MIPVLPFVQGPIAQGLPLPYYAYPGDAGLQLPVAEDVVLEPGKWTAVKTGLRVDIPAGYFGDIRSRGASAQFGLGEDLTVVDAPYEGELTLMVWNKSSDFIEVKRGDVVAQMVMLRFEEFQPVGISSEEYDAKPATERGTGRVGSSGHKPRKMRPEEVVAYLEAKKLAAQ